MLDTENINTILADMGKCYQYILLLRNISKSLLFKILAPLWTLASIYDLLLSQFVPEKFSKQVPKTWEVAVMTGNLLPYWGWLLILAAILIIALFEWGIRQQYYPDKYKLLPPQENSLPTLPESADRPWIKVEFTPTLPLTFPDGPEGKEMVRMDFRVTLTNVGRTIATNVRFASRMYLLSNDLDKIRGVKKIKEVCDDRLSLKNCSEETIFPGDKIFYNIYVQSEITQDNLNIGTYVESGKYCITPIVVGCVDYQSPSSPIHHQTGFMYSIYVNTPGSIIYVGQDIPAERLILKTDWPPGSYFVN